MAADLLAQDPVRAPHVVRALRRDRRGLEPEAGFDDGSGGLVDDSVTGCPARFEREVEAIELQRHAHDVRGKDAQRFLEQFLTRLVALQDDDVRLVTTASLEASCDVQTVTMLRRQTEKGGNTEYPSDVFFHRWKGP